MKKDFLYVDDLIYGCIKIINSGKHGKPYNIVFGKSIKIKEAVSDIFNSLSIKKNKAKIIFDKNKPVTVKIRKFSNLRAKNEIKFQPKIKFQQGIKKTIAWYKKELNGKKIFDNFKNKKILVTGGTGLIGRQLIKVFNENNIKVISVSLDDYKLDDFNEYLYGDLTNLDYCRKITKGCDYIFHLAGIKGSADVTIKKMSSHFVPTIMMNTNVLDSARFNSVNNLVYTSSIGAYENNEIFKEDEYNIASQPMDFAGWAKRLAELQIYSYKKQYDLKGYKIVRPSNVYGPGDNFDPKNAMVIPSILNRILNKENPLMYGEMVLQ